MDDQILELFAVGPLRRDVKALRQAAAEVSAGDPVRVTVRSPRHGLYLVDGTARSGVGGQLMVADVFLGPSSEIQRIDASEPVVAPVAPAPAGSASDYAHGDLVEVTFASDAHGPFTVIGPLTAGADRFLQVGGWIVFDGELVAPRVASIEKLDQAEVHPGNVPPVRRPLDAGAPAVSDDAA